MNQNNYYHKVRLWTNQKTISKLIVATSGVHCEADVWPCKIGPSLCAYQQYKTDILMGKRHFAPLFYPRSGNKLPNVSKLLDDPPEFVNVWQNLPSVQLPVCLDGKSVMCMARDLLMHFTFQKYPCLFHPFESTWASAATQAGPQSRHLCCYRTRRTATLQAGERSYRQGRAETELL